MTDLLIIVIYSICASGVLVWTTLLRQERDLRVQRPRSEIESMAISRYSLFELAACDPNLVIFDAHTDRGIGGCAELTSFWLPISTNDLPSLLEWLPPASKVVFCCREATLELDTRAKTMLFERGIETVYFLDESHIFEPYQGDAVAAKRPGESSNMKKNIERNEATHMT